MERTLDPRSIGVGVRQVDIEHCLFRTEVVYRVDYVGLDVSRGSKIVLPYHDWSGTNYRSGIVRESHVYPTGFLIVLEDVFQQRRNAHGTLMPWRRYGSIDTHVYLWIAHDGAHWTGASSGFLSGKPY